MVRSGGRASVAEEQLPRLAAIVGEAGIGKTRLADELIRRMEPGTVVYRGHCLPYGEGITYWPLREIVWAAAGILLDDPGPAASAKLCALVGRLIADRADADRTASALDGALTTRVRARSVSGVTVSAAMKLWTDCLSPRSRIARSATVVLCSMTTSSCIASGGFRMGSGPLFPPGICVSMIVVEAL